MYLQHYIRVISLVQKGSVTSLKKIKIIIIFVCWKIISVFGKLESGKFLPFMEILIFEFNNCI
jgi:hypothetical protein